MFTRQDTKVFAGPWDRVIVIALDDPQEAEKKREALKTLFDGDSAKRTLVIEVTEEMFDYVVNRPN